MLGRTSASNPLPSTDTQPSWVAKIWISIIPIQKLGSDSPVRASVMHTVSIQPLGRRPAMTPSMLPSNTPIMKPPMASCNV